MREARPEDVPAILGFVRALAEYENLAHEMEAREEDFARALFGPRPHAHALLAEVGEAPVGLALWFYNFSTFAGRPGIFVEDVFVDPAFRGRGIGRAFFRALAQRAIAEGCRRLEWWVLDWNQPALHFYRSIGARAMEEWTVQRVAGPALAALAATEENRHG
ncbi:MAG: GNAT family N-acetyltransferase [Acetobacteraceae bacterium]